MSSPDWSRENALGKFPSGVETDGTPKVEFEFGLYWVYRKDIQKQKS